MDNTDKTNKFSIVRILISVVFLLWFVVSITGLLYCARNEMHALLIAIFGQYFIVFGVIATCANAPKRVKTKTDTYLGGKGILKFNIGFFIGLFVTLIGLGCAIVGLIFQYGDKSLKDVMTNMIPVFGCLIFVIAGAGIVCVTLYKRWYNDTYVNYPVIATVVDVETQISKSGGHSVILYAPTWEYDYNGEHFVQTQNYYSNYGKCDIGDKIAIRINPEIPTEFASERESDVPIIIFGCMFLAAGILAMICIIQNFGNL